MLQVLGKTPVQVVVRFSSVRLGSPRFSSVLLNQVVDDPLLAAIQPAREYVDEEDRRLETRNKIRRLLAVS